MTTLSLHQSRRTSAHARPQRFVFAGIAFELLPTPGAGRRYLSGELARFVAPHGVHAVADVLCSLCFDKSLAVPGAGVGVLEVEVGSVGLPGLSLRGAGVRVELRRLGRARYAASIRLAPDPELLPLALRVLASAVVEREGGLTLHAVGVELQGQALLLVGPSGAGKSTACGLIRDARCFADDHVVVLPSAGGYRAWGLPGGGPASVPVSASPSHAVRGVLRVRRGRTAPALQAEDAASQLFIVRESTEGVGRAPHLEAARMAAAARLCSEVAVGSLHTVLGQRLRARLGDSLGVYPLLEGEA